MAPAAELRAGDAEGEILQERDLVSVRGTRGSLMAIRSMIRCVGRPRGMVKQAELRELLGKCNAIGMVGSDLLHYCRGWSGHVTFGFT